MSNLPAPVLDDSSWLNALPPNQRHDAALAARNSKARNTRRALPSGWKQLVFEYVSTRLNISHAKLAVILGLSRKSITARMRDHNDELHVFVHAVRSDLSARIIEPVLKRVLDKPDDATLDSRRIQLATMVDPELHPNVQSARAGKSDTFVNVNNGGQQIILKAPLSFDQWLARLPKQAEGA